MQILVILRSLCLQFFAIFIDEACLHLRRHKIWPLKHFFFPLIFPYCLLFTEKALPYYVLYIQLLSHHFVHSGIPADSFLYFFEAVLILDETILS